MAAPVRLCLLGLAAALLACTPARADDPPAEGDPRVPSAGVLRDSFESPRTAWREEATDQAFRLLAHDRSDVTAHEGRYSEHFVFEAGPGSALYYSYPLPRTPLVEELRATLYVRSNRPGVQIFGQVLLPADRDPATGDLTKVFVPGTIALAPDHWQRVELSDLLVDVERQARVIRNETGRAVSLEGAYLARIVVNLYGGPGGSEVFLDELAVSPVPREDGAATASDEGGAAPGAEGAPARGGSRVQLVGPVLKRDGMDWFPRIVRAPGADLALLWRAGFDVLDVDPFAEPELAAKATELGFLLMPRLDLREGTDPAVAASAIANLPQRDAIAFLDLGEALGSIRDPRRRRAELERVRGLIFAAREQGRAACPATGTVDGLFTEYAQFGGNLDLIGVDVPPPGGMIDYQDLYRYLEQRRAITATSNPNGLFWARVPVASPSAVRSAVWGMDVPPAWGWPQVQPEQMRLATYAALSAGYRGFGVLGDADLTSAVGLPRLYEASLLIAEVALVESILARNGDPVTQWEAFPPDPKIKITYNASGLAGGFSSAGRGGQQQKKDLKEVAPLGSMRVACIDSEDGRTKVLFVADYAGNAQYVPGHMAMKDLNLRVPAPESAQAYEICLGGLKKLESHRDVGGRRIVIPAFNVSALVILTTDPTLRSRMEEQINRLRPRAVDIALRQAELQIQEVEALDPLLRQQGVRLAKRNENLLADARRIWGDARDALERQDFAYAWSDARAVGQPLRMLMREYFEEGYKQLVKATEANAKAEGPAIRDEAGKLKRPPQLISPVAFPPLLSRNTLPRFPLWRDAIKGAYGPFGPNLVQGGGFDDPSAMARDGWVSAGYPVEGLATELKVVNNEGWGNPRSALRLRVVPDVEVDKDLYLKPDGKLDDEAYKKALFDTIDRFPPTQDHPVAAIRTPPIPVKAKNFVRIRVLAKMPREQNKGVGGLIVRDSLGGEALQFRTTDAIPEWKEIVLYRQAPSDGELTITFGLAGYGDAFFDDLRVDVITDPSRLPADGRPGESIARRPGRGEAAAPPSPSLPRR
jgi:hypothetical protein